MINMEVFQKKLTKILMITLLGVVVVLSGCTDKYLENFHYKNIPHCERNIHLRCWLYENETLENWC